MITPILALAGVVILSAAAQLILKRNAVRLITGRGFRTFVSSISPILIVAGIGFLAAPLFYFYALTRLELGFAFFAAALTQGVVVLGGRIFLRERLHPLHIAGICLVMAGVLIWNL